MSEDFERLSRYRAGELSSDEAKALEAEPGFAEQMRQLDLLDATTRQLSTELSSEKVVDLLANVKRPPARAPARVDFRVGLALVAAVIALVVWKGVTAEDAGWALLTSGEVTVDGHQAATTQRLQRGSTVHTAPNATAQLISPNGWIGLPGGSTLADAPERGRLIQGNAVVSARAQAVWAGDVRVEVHGLAVLSMEPSEGVARVTDTLAHLSSGDRMPTQWMKLSTVAMTAAAVGGGLTLFVVDGHASVRPVDGAPIEVKAGEQWKPGQTQGSPTRPAGPVAEAVQPQELPAVKVAEPSGPADLSQLTRPELVAMVERLRDERESLLSQREQLKKKLDGNDQPRRNYYRFSPQELTDLAKQGEFRLRGPQLSGNETKVDDKVKDELRLTPEEVAGVKAIFESSTERAHEGLLGFYKELGGDPSLGSTLGSDPLFNELRNKSLKGDWEDAVRLVANERAGLVEPTAGGTPVMKALRMLLAEEERTLNELDALLGPARAEQLLSHDSSPHHSHGFGVGPAGARKP
jgi:hypothetical protein